MVKHGGDPKPRILEHFSVPSHQLAFGLPCYSALLSVPVWHASSFNFLFPLYTKELEVWETEVTVFLHCFPDSPCGKWKRRNRSVLCHSQSCASNHTSATQFLLSVFLKRAWSPYHAHRQKTWITPPALQRAPVVGSKQTTNFQTV